MLPVVLSLVYIGLIVTSCKLYPWMSIFNSNYRSANVCTTCELKLKLKTQRRTLSDASYIIQGRPKKWGHKLMTIILSNVNRFTHFFTERFLGKFAVNWLLKIPPLLAYISTLPCKTLTTLMSENKRLTIYLSHIAFNRTACVCRFVPITQQCEKWRH